jgi:lipopolysaccharide export system protein LptC
MIEGEEAQPIDFTFFYYIGKSKLNLSFKETGRLTYRIFSKLYQHYKDNFDLEMQMRYKNVTYKELYSRKQQEEEWF